MYFRDDTNQSRNEGEATEALNFEKFFTLKILIGLIFRPRLKTLIVIHIVVMFLCAKNSFYILDDNMYHN